MEARWTLQNGAWVATGPGVPENLLLGFTTREAGDMTDPLARKTLAESFGARTVRILTQVHGVRLVDPATPDGEEADGWLGAPVPGELLAVKCADCLPVLLWNEDASLVAAVHAGWRGATGGICRNAVEELGVNPSTLSAAIGPAIGRCCYEVGEEVAAAASLHPETLTPRGGSKYQFDLAGYAALDLLAAGVLAENILRLDHCTACLGESYASHRATRAPERQCGFIGLAQ